MQFPTQQDSWGGRETITSWEQKRVTGICEKEKNRRNSLDSFDSFFHQMVLRFWSLSLSVSLFPHRVYCVYRKTDGEALFLYFFRHFDKRLRLGLLSRLRLNSSSRLWLLPILSWEQRMCPLRSNCLFLWRLYMYCVYFRCRVSIRKTAVLRMVIKTGKERDCYW